MRKVLNAKVLPPMSILQYRLAADATIRPYIENGAQIDVDINSIIFGVSIDVVLTISLS